MGGNTSGLVSGKIPFVIQGVHLGIAGLMARTHAHNFCIQPFVSNNSISTNS